MTNEQFERFESLLIRIATTLEEKVPKRKVDKAYEDECKKRATNMVPRLIATYITSWQTRYGTEARPDVGGRAIGVLKRLATSWKEEMAHSLIQVFCQMDDPFFVTRRHDLQTFEANLNKVSLALDKGHEQTGVNYTTIFGGADGKGSLSSPNGQSNKDLGGPKLPAGETRHLLEGV